MVSIEDFLPNVSEGNLLYNFFLPFLLIFAILYGALTILRLFNKRINFVLALIFTLLTTATPVFSWFATILPTYGAIAAVGTFAAIFIVGFLSYAISKGKETYYTAKYAGGPRLDRLQKLHKDYQKLQEEFQKATDRNERGKAHKILEEMERLDREMKIESSRR